MSRILRLSTWFLYWYKNKTGWKERDRVEQMKTIQNEALDLFAKKNQDYGDAFAVYGVMGVLIRMEDKLHRALSITKTSITLVDEGLRDTLLDLHNYAAMALMLMDEPCTETEPRVILV